MPKRKIFYIKPNLIKVNFTKSQFYPNRWFFIFISIHTVIMCLFLVMFVNYSTDVAPKTLYKWVNCHWRGFQAFKKQILLR